MELFLEVAVFYGTVMLIIMVSVAGLLLRDYCNRWMSQRHWQREELKRVVTVEVSDSGGYQVVD